MFTPINMDKITGDRKKKEFALDVLNNDLFPHCKSKIQKIYNELERHRVFFIKKSKT